VFATKPLFNILGDIAQQRTGIWYNCAKKEKINLKK
jgi:hypothetical protein